jgi:(5-formylfuran-3-yl)methyl phosphate synthase
MRLLVSVRSEVEVAQALAGGADVIDAKEPSLGSLGAVSLATLSAIARRVPADVPLSVALGDPRTAEHATEAMAAVLGVLRRGGEQYVKLGLSGVVGCETATELLAAAVIAARRGPTHSAQGLGVIAVAYADHVAAAAPAPADVTRTAAKAGARGILLDTYRKDGRDLFSHLGAAALQAWVEDARAAGLLVALAGSLSGEALRRVAMLPADIVGVRGSACVGGREGHVTEARVRVLRSMLDRSASAANAAW